MKTIVQSLLKPFGLRLVRERSVPKREFGADVLFATLSRFGFAPLHILDVGANRGNWTRAALCYFPNAKYTLVEPQDNLRVYVQDLLGDGRQIQWINAGVGEESTKLPFHISVRDDSSTFVPLEGSVFSGTTMVEMKSIDDLLVEYQLPVPDIVKIDAEGMDLKAIGGANRILGKTEIILLEAAVLCPFENSVLKLINFMDERGYQLVDITEINRSPKHGVLWLTELAFLRNASPLFASAISYE